MFEEHFKEDMVFIPSSIHEIIAIPKRTAPGPEEINAMVRQVNADYVSEEEILSGHVYYFDRAKKEIYYLTKQ